MSAIQGIFDEVNPILPVMCKKIIVFLLGNVIFNVVLLY